MLLCGGVDARHSAHTRAKGIWLWETTPLHLVVGGRGDVDILRLLLQAGVDPNDTKATSVPLNGAVMFSTPELVELLVECGADLDLGTGTHGIREAAELKVQMRKALMRAEMRRDLKRKKEGGCTWSGFALVLTRVDHDADFSLP